MIEKYYRDVLSKIATYASERNFSVYMQVIEKMALDALNGRENEHNQATETDSK